jgi:hypothetical protein
MLTTFPGAPAVGFTLTIRGAQAEDDVTDRQATKITRNIFNRRTKYFMQGSTNSLMAQNKSLSKGPQID